MTADERFSRITFRKTGAIFLVTQHSSASYFSFPFTRWHQLSHLAQSRTIMKHVNGLYMTARRPTQQQLSSCLLSYLVDFQWFRTSISLFFISSLYIRRILEASSLALHPLNSIHRPPHPLFLVLNRSLTIPITYCTDNVEHCRRSHDLHVICQETSRFSVLMYTLVADRCMH